ncbi:uncharacterized protein LOC131876422 [Cryptomeria japonica]|uniref:uncharacterized protein LOC131876422 n=1 Tax=Cryptomeria japonica TaxID=3369 RepID=UPI0027DA2CF1|nr:uncharacterized protein LOC131876422 [Cryptomeria japonica]
MNSRLFKVSKTYVCNHGFSNCRKPMSVITAFQTVSHCLDVSKTFLSSQQMELGESYFISFSCNLCSLSAQIAMFYDVMPSALNLGVYADVVHSWLRVRHKIGIKWRSRSCKIKPDQGRSPPRTIKQGQGRPPPA